MMLLPRPRALPSNNLMGDTVTFLSKSVHFIHSERVAEFFTEAQIKKYSQDVSGVFVRTRTRYAPTVLCNIRY